MYLIFTLHFIILNAVAQILLALLRLQLLAHV